MNKIYYEWLRKSDELSNELINACHDGDLEKVKEIFAYSHPHIKPNIHFMHDSAFYYAMLKQHMHILHYLIIEQKIPKTPAIDSYLNNKASKIAPETIDKAITLFMHNT